MLCCHRCGPIITALPACITDYYSHSRKEQDPLYSCHLYCSTGHALIFYHFYFAVAFEYVQTHHFPNTLNSPAAHMPSWPSLLGRATHRGTHTFPVSVYETCGKHMSVKLLVLNLEVTSPRLLAKQLGPVCDTDGGSKTTLQPLQILDYCLLFHPIVL